MITDILQHPVKWWVYSKVIKELPESDIEHIERMIKEGYSQGELCVSWHDRSNRYHETRGWWQIQK